MNMAAGLPACSPICRCGSVACWIAFCARSRPGRCGRAVSRECLHEQAGPAQGRQPRRGHPARCSGGAGTRRTANRHAGRMPGAEPVPLVARRLPGSGPPRVCRGPSRWRAGHPQTHGAVRRNSARATRHGGHRPLPITRGGHGARLGLLHGRRTTRPRSGTAPEQHPAAGRRRALRSARMGLDGGSIPFGGHAGRQRQAAVPLDGRAVGAAAPLCVRGAASARGLVRAYPGTEKQSGAGPAAAGTPARRCLE